MPKSKSKSSQSIAEKRKRNPSRTVIYTDGSCLGNNLKDVTKRKAGYGIYYGENDERNVSAKLKGLPTNNRAELMAIIHALQDNKDKGVLIKTDSTYCKDIITKWMAGWKRKNWKTSRGKPVKNVKMIKVLDNIICGMSVKPQFEWVKAHASSVGNNEADRLANEGALL